MFALIFMVQTKPFLTNKKCMHDMMWQLYRGEATISGSKKSEEFVLAFSRNEMKLFSKDGDKAVNFLWAVIDEAVHLRLLHLFKHFETSFPQEGMAAQLFRHPKNKIKYYTIFDL